MKRFNAKADAQAAEAATTSRHLMCHANGCPNRWAVQREGSGGLCSAHAWSDPHLWPRITQEVRDAETDRARQAGERDVGAEEQRLTLADKRAILERLRGMDFSRPGQNGKAWAHALKAREGRGERLTPAQRAMWRAALGPAAADEEQR